MIEVRGVSKYYGRFIGVRDLTFEVPQGQVVALVGPNGAGKTTIIRILTGFLQPSVGTVRVAGCDLPSNRLAAAARTGYLPENGPVYPDMTPAALLRFFGEARGLAARELSARLDHVVDQCELGEIFEKPIGKLSKGLRQRVGLAQALLHDPAVLVMDEPTSGLDPNQIRRFREHVGQLRRNATLLISTHILQEVEAVAERVILMHQGRLVFDGTPPQMKADGTLEEFFYRTTSQPS